MNVLLNRTDIEHNFIEVLNNFEANKNNLLTKRGIYLYGSPGSGKSHFCKEILKKLNYDIIVFDAGDIRNKSVIENIKENDMSGVTVESAVYGALAHGDENSAQASDVKSALQNPINSMELYLCTDK